MTPRAKAFIIIFSLVISLLVLKNGYIRDAVFNNDGGLAVYAVDYGRYTQHGEGKKVYFFDKNGTLLRTLSFDVRGSLKLSADTTTVTIRHGNICEYFDYSGSLKQNSDGEPITQVYAPDMGIMPFTARIEQNKLFYEYITTNDNGITREIHLDKQLYYSMLKNSVFMLLFTLVILSIAVKKTDEQITAFKSYHKKYYDNNNCKKEQSNHEQHK